MKRFQLILLISAAALSTAFLVAHTNSNNKVLIQVDVEQLPVEEVLLMLGDDSLLHSILAPDPEKVELGKSLVLNGYAIYEGKKSKRISKHFVCTDCHNLTREFDNITSELPGERLDYAINNGEVFLPGSTFWGIYNRTTFYNKDYVKKYGDLVINARDTLENAVQVCAKYCSSGRYLEPWELEAIMHYYKSLELRIKDLSLPNPTLKLIRKYAQLNDTERKDLIQTIRAAYIQKYDATFLETMPRDQRKYGEGGNVARGEAIYEKSCLHCHGQGRVTYLTLGQNKLDARMFWKNRKNYSDKSLYQILRHGTYAKAGRKQYMPLYTEEKMSDDQINDLMAYLKQLAGK